MSDQIELAKALGWPIASIVMSITIVLAIWRVTASSGDLSLKVKDWVNLDRKSSPLPNNVSSSENQIIPIEDKTISSAETLADVAEQDSDKNIDIFWIESDSNNIKENFDQFRSTSSYNNDAEFWESLYIDRQRELGMINEETELRLLADGNQS